MANTPIYQLSREDKEREAQQKEEGQPDPTQPRQPRQSGTATREGLLSKLGHLFVSSEPPGQEPHGAGTEPPAEPEEGGIAAEGDLLKQKCCFLFYVILSVCCCCIPMLVRLGVRSSALH